MNVFRGKTVKNKEFLSLSRDFVQVTTNKGLSTIDCQQMTAKEWQSTSDFQKVSKSKS